MEQNIVMDEIVLNNNFENGESQAQVTPQPRGMQGVGGGCVGFGGGCAVGHGLACGIYCGGSGCGGICG